MDKKALVHQLADNPDLEIVGFHRIGDVKGIQFDRPRYFVPGRQ